MDTSPGLMEYGCCADEVDRDVVGGYKVGEMDELVKMAVCYEGYHHYYYSVAMVHFFDWL